jgi:uncharacterized protein HemX
VIKPWGVVAALAAAIGMSVGGFVFGVKYQRGQEAYAQQLIRDTREQAALGAADAIAKQKKEVTIIKQQLETITRVEEVYRDCRNTPDAQRLLNDALKGERTESTGGGKLPGIDGVGR